MGVVFKSNMLESGSMVNSARQSNQPTGSDQVNNKDKIYSVIKADIIRCALEPGSAISEAKLAARYAVGKAPVRDALARL
ncbi:MAG TPA: GntR family transcriptional regulator, partial [Rhodobacteraceae bacterium]|nr:GntR family transcriptional regulator [Paracoccaceae bacterium]